MTPETLAKLTPEQKRVRIAELCRWKGELTLMSGGSKRVIWRNQNGAAANDDFLPPDYLNDLNAMHEAEQVLLSKGLGQRYIENLRECIPTRNSALIYHATAAQRADAFLLTLG